MEGGGVAYNFESGQIKDHLSSNFWKDDLNVIFPYQNICIHKLHNLYKLVERKLEKIPNIYIELVSVMQLQFKFELILAYNKVAIKT